ncbi:MAG: hypothetical protein KDB16_20735, partial [Acidimicrobiales bacterium]|nr:hypothetical protein [Acidimicrobiales bacterium]
VRHIVEGTRSVVASPASFNNTAGLSRTVNEHLSPDTEVFVAEMGTYGPGEIRDLCSWVKPDVSALCAIGPVHLERMGSLDNIVAAKSEIFDTAGVAVLNIDAHGLAAVAERLRHAGDKRVITTSTNPDSDADVRVFPAQHSDGVRVCVGNDCDTVDLPADAIHSNVAVAVAIGCALDIPVDKVRLRLGTLPGAGHRRERSVSPTGVNIIDDTYNSNPAGAAAALDALGATPAARRVVVTPGMVEMGAQQAKANEEFAESAAAVADVVLIVGQTNRKALLAGASRGAAEVIQTRTRTEAVEWVRRNLDAGDAVLYENDLPDHYP